MAKKIAFLLKFGKEAHIKQFIDGSLFFSTAEVLRKIERENKIKGQGDILEASSKLYIQKMTIQELNLNDCTFINSKKVGILQYEPADQIPVFCLFSVYEDDCNKNVDGTLSISLSDESKMIIREHFPNTDTVAIISDPEKFITDVKESIGCRIEHGSIKYYNTDKGINDNDDTLNEMEYYEYLTQDVPPVIENGKTIYSFHADYVYRALFCKDVYFAGEQEYRIVLPEESISVGTHYPIKLSERIVSLSLNGFFDNT